MHSKISFLGEIISLISLISSCLFCSQVVEKLTLSAPHGTNHTLSWTKAFINKLTENIQRFWKQHFLWSLILQYYILLKVFKRWRQHWVLFRLQHLSCFGIRISVSTIGLLSFSINGKYYDNAMEIWSISIRTSAQS